MRVGALAILCISSFASASCNQQPANRQQSNGQEIETNGATVSASVNPLCEILQTGQNDLGRFAEQINREGNPLRRDSAQRSYEQRVKALVSQATSLLTNNQMENWVGVISYLSLQSYNSGPGVNLSVALPCKARITFQFVTTNPSWGSPSSQNVALEPWRTTLENLAVGDTVTFSGRPFFRNGLLQITRNPNEQYEVEVEAVLTDLRKGLRSQDAPGAAPSFSRDDAISVARRAGVIPSQLTIQIIQMPTFGEGHSQSWADFAAKVNTFKTILEKHGWTVMGYDHLGAFYYHVQGSIAPSAAAQQWILAPVTGYRFRGYSAVLFENAEITVPNFDVRAESATAIFNVKYTGCTPICELWKDIRGENPEIGQALFVEYNPSFDPDALYSATVKFSWDPQLGWHVRR